MELALKKDDAETHTKSTAFKSAADTHKMSDEAKRGRDLFFHAKSNCSAMSDKMKKLDLTESLCVDFNEPPILVSECSFQADKCGKIRSLTVKTAGTVCDDFWWS